MVEKVGKIFLNMLSPAAVALRKVTNQVSVIAKDAANFDHVFVHIAAVEDEMPGSLHDANHGPGALAAETDATCSSTFDHNLRPLNGTGEVRVCLDVSESFNDEGLITQPSVSAELHFTKS